ncbi:MAG TPA: hypothetical protein VIY54_03395 [Steroidobacteraceae bacterium]
MGTVIRGLFLAATGRKTTRTIAEHSTDVLRTSRAREATAEDPPNRKCRRPDRHGESRHLLTDGQQWRQRETEENDGEGDTVCLHHVPSQPFSNRHVLRNDGVCRAPHQAVTDEASHLPMPGRQITSSASAA